jgi:ribosome biogenesis GTPase A
MERYHLKELKPSGEEVLSDIALFRGLIGHGGKPLEEDAAILLIQEFRNGKLGAFTLETPPKKTFCGGM